MDCLRDNTTKVRNIKQYMRAMLFNAPSTINSYYAVSYTHLSFWVTGPILPSPM